MRRRTFCALAPAALLAACASPNPVLYTLATVPGAATPGAARKGAPRNIELRRIGLAAYLDRPTIVRGTEDYRVQLANDDRWAEPIGDMIARILVQDLSQRLPDSTVFSDTGAITAEPDEIVEMDLRRFDTDHAGRALLDAEVSIRLPESHRAVATRSIRLSVGPSGPGTAALVAALSMALGQLADQLAEMLSARHHRR